MITSSVQKELHQKRLNSIIRILKDKQLNGLLLFGRANIRYITGMRTNTESLSVIALSSSEDIIYNVPTLDYQVTVEECWLSMVGEIKSFSGRLENSFDSFENVFSAGSRIGVDLNKLSASSCNELKTTLKAIIVESIDEEMLKIRSIKDSYEIELIRESARIADLGIQEAIKLIGSGTKEYEVTLWSKLVMEAEGAEGLSFEPFAMSGINSCKPKRYSTSRLMEKGDLVVIDLGCIYKGYCSDITRTVSIGEFQSVKRDIFQLAYFAQQETIKKIRPGIICSEVDAVARDIINSEGFGDYFPHLTGHGIGLDIHELPEIDTDSEMQLCSGMVVTVEPGIYLPDIGGARIEDMVLVTDSGYEVLTDTRRKIVV